MTHEMTINDSNIDGRKYITFNREQFFQMLGEQPWSRTANMAGVISDFDDIELDDAVVIRKRDVFAAIGLYAYANACRIAVEVAEQVPSAIDVDHLNSLADFMIMQADHARAMSHRLPT